MKENKAVSQREILLGHDIIFIETLAIQMPSHIIFSRVLLAPRPSEAPFVAAYYENLRHACNR
jgi:hypothetical protein